MTKFQTPEIGQHVNFGVVSKDIQDGREERIARSRKMLLDCVGAMNKILQDFSITEGDIITAGSASTVSVVISHLTHCANTISDHII